MKKKSLLISLDVDLHQWIKEEAKRLRGSMSQVIRLAIVSAMMSQLMREEVLKRPKK